MTHRRLAVALAVPAAFGLALLPVSGAVADNHVAMFMAEATGDQEPDGGLEDGSGSATFTADVEGGEFCYDATAEGVDDAVAHHIHVGEAGVNGDVVIDLGEPTLGEEVCVEADSSVLEDVMANPEGYYWNVHTPDFPGGAIRGQLMASGGTPGSVDSGTGGLFDDSGAPLLPVVLVMTGAAVVGAAGWRLARR